jgi:hypothetical protein
VNWCGLVLPGYILLTAARKFVNPGRRWKKQHNLSKKVCGGVMNLFLPGNGSE